MTKRVRKKCVSFSEWIDEIGVDRLASQLGVVRSAVFHWKAGRHHPRTEQMKEIIRLSKGEMSFDLIMAPRGQR